MSSNETNKTSIHAGHRERLRKRFTESNGTALENHELLEMLLFGVIPRANTNNTAHNLIKECGSLKNVFEADPEILRQVPGAGDATATYFSLLHVIGNRIEMEKYSKTRFKADTLSKVGNYLVDYYKNKHNEEICAMLLDNSMRLIEFITLSLGSASSASIDVREFARKAICCNATGVILAHNHPSGDLTPSPSDTNFTLEMDRVLRTVKIELVEHIIVGPVAYTPTMHMRLCSQNSSNSFQKYKKFYDN